MGVTLSETKINECLKTGDEQIDCVDTGCTLMLLQKVQDINKYTYIRGILPNYNDKN